MFASAREAAGTGRDTIGGSTVGDVLDGACARYGAEFERVLTRCRIWLNGEPTDRATTVTDTDEVGVLPPVSGG